MNCFNLSKSVIILFLTCTDTPPATSPLNPSAVAVARRNVRIIQGKFSMLVTKSRKRLQSRGINVEDLKAFLITMCSSPNPRDGSYNVTTLIASIKSLNEIFCALSDNGLWDYFNYFLLQSIIEEFASDDAAWAEVYDGAVLARPNRPHPHFADSKIPRCHPLQAPYCHEWQWQWQLRWRGCSISSSTTAKT